ncbi:MAG: histidine phosphatase family protein [Acidimicrobiia bacterium]|nr:histidine phosphatase family protein [Acidimicrobiia bacterium]
MTVFLVRHGEVENPDRVVYADIPGFGLSERGRREAAAAAEFLGGISVDAIYASPLDRAQETASYISKACGVPISSREDLTEWLVARRWKGVMWEDLPTAFPGELEAYLEHPTDLPFAEESISMLGDRVASAARELAAAHPDGNIVLVSHQDPIQAGRLILRGLPLTELHLNRPGHCDVLTLEPGEPWMEIGYWVPDIEGDPPPEWPPVSGGSD